MNSVLRTNDSYTALPFPILKAPIVVSMIAYSADDSEASR